MVIVIAFVFFFFVPARAGGSYASLRGRQNYGILLRVASILYVYRCNYIARFGGVLCSLLVGSGCHGSVSFFLCVWKLWHKLCSCIFVFVSLVCS